MIDEDVVVSVAVVVDGNTIGDVAIASVEF